MDVVAAKKRIVRGIGRVVQNRVRRRQFQKQARQFVIQSQFPSAALRLITLHVAQAELAAVVAHQQAIGRAVENAQSLQNQIRVRSRPNRELQSALISCNNASFCSSTNASCFQLRDIVPTSGTRWAQQRASLVFACDD
jgi:hypothetical protein